MADQAETVVHKTRYLPTKKNLIAARYGSPSLNKGGGGCGGGGRGGRIGEPSLPEKIRLNRPAYTGFKVYLCHV